MLQRLSHLLGIENLTNEQIAFILDQAKPFQEFQRHPLKKLATLRGKTVAIAFFESSTRTRISFTTAASRLGADTMTLQAESSSLKKGESLIDTVRTLEAMRPDGIVIRHASSGAPEFVAQRLEIPVLNAGDGTHEHPTQALLDALTIRDRKGKLEGWNVTILGDILHSRVARSNIHLAQQVWRAASRCAARPCGCRANSRKLAPGIRVVHCVSRKRSTAPTSSWCCACKRSAFTNRRSRLTNTFSQYQLTPARLRSRSPMRWCCIPAR